jgi:uncharacterized membrane protein YdbT with pleckstrin-like domain
MSDEFFLLSDEHLIEGFAPLPAFRKYLFFRWFCFAFIGGSFIITLLTVEMPELYLPQVAGGDFVLSEIVLLPFCLIFSFVVSHRAYGKRYYWITTRRIAMQHGILFTRTRMIPLTAVEQMDVSHSLFEDYFDVPSLKIESSEGNITLGGILFPEGIYLELKSLVRQRRESAGMVF